MDWAQADGRKAAALELGSINADEWKLITPPGWKTRATSHIMCKHRGIGFVSAFERAALTLRILEAWRIPACHSSRVDTKGKHPSLGAPLGKVTRKPEREQDSFKQRSRGRRAQRCVPLL